ncbi:hypothetical protein [Oceanobacillus sp. J11TS1]|uniref:hypothetical protein n=1 Tax=Oceanobacillus sp. J11TS1 TaxID=2807191 RepID=UPI001B08864A|nr:hypothetical protein [Oceanobacillus sp. J11TS1]GIO23264.1 hypothetical protein J11TS1_18450 [Oceanobacillus sp. J11TS1]
MNHLKRYWITYIALIFISVIIIGFYLVDKKEVAFNWKTVSGDEEVVKDVLIFGEGQSAYGRMVADPFQLSIDESKRIEQPRGFFGSTYQDLQIEKYIDEYRSFMRGKNQWIENFTETDNQLIYVNEEVQNWGEQSNLHVEILNKETEDVTEFEVPIEEQAHQIYGINSVTANKDKLYVQVYMEGQYDETADIYTDENAILIIDINDQTIEDIKFPEKDVPLKEGIYTSLMYQDSGLIDGEMNYLYIYEEYKEDQNGTIVEDVPLKYELQLYNIERDTIKSVDLETNAYGSDFVKIYDGAVYSGMLQGENYTLMKYDENLKEKEVFDANVLNGDLEVNQEDVYPLTNMHNGYFYIVYPAYSTLTVADISINAFDMETGENVYQGIIQAEDAMKQYHYFDLYQLEFKDE